MQTQISSEANWSGSTLFAKTGHVVFSKRRVKLKDVFQIIKRIHTMYVCVWGGGGGGGGGGEGSALLSFHTVNNIQSTLVISKSKGLPEILRDIRTSTYQLCTIEEKIKSNNHISLMNM